MELQLLALKRKAWLYDCALLGWVELARRGERPSNIMGTRLGHVPESQRNS